MAGLFDELLETTPNTLPRLKICHTTRDDKINFESILKKQLLKTTKCPVYDEYLLYTFYGRATYKLPAMYYPMCFIFNLSDEDAADIKRKVAFDTGAFHSGRMDKYFKDKGALKEHFEINTTDLKCLTQFVNFFFINNKHYFNGQINDTLQDLKNDLLNAYLKMIKDPDDSSLDSRRRTLEIQFGKDFDLKIKKPEMLIISSAFVRTDAEKTKLEANMGGKVLIYEQSMSGDYYELINGLVRQHFEQKRLL